MQLLPKVNINPKGSHFMNLSLLVVAAVSTVVLGACSDAGSMATTTAAPNKAVFAIDPAIPTVVITANRMYDAEKRTYDASTQVRVAQAKPAQ